MRPFVHYYDAIYSDKNYLAETEILHGLVKSPARPAILEIGSGTGNQSTLLSTWADVTAVETDADFASVMRGKCAATKSVTLFEGDIAKLAASGFDGAAAYFHVANYIHDASALAHLLNEMGKRLKSGAPILFDMWHAECVLNDPPGRVERIKQYDNYLGRGRVTQRIDPSMDAAKRNVTLNYTVTIECSDGKPSPTPFTETIHLHLWRQDEIVTALRNAGFGDAAFYDSKTYPQAATPQSWAVWVVAYKK
jgi:SAM-dependent methyltransferase